MDLIAQELIALAKQVLAAETWQDLGYDDSMAKRMLQRYGPPDDRAKVHFKVKNAYKTISDYDFNLSTTEGWRKMQEAAFKALDKEFPGVLTIKDVTGLYKKLHKQDSAIGMDMWEWTTDLIEKKLKKAAFGFNPRFVKEEDMAELANLWHLSRVPTSGDKQSDKLYNRMQWTSKEFAKAHPEYTPTAVYKDLDGFVRHNHGR